MVIRWVFHIKLVPKLIELLKGVALAGERGGVDQIIVALPGGRALRPKALQRDIAQVPQLRPTVKLIEGEAISLVVQKGRLPLLLFLLTETVLDGVVKIRAGLPLLTGDGKEAVVVVKVLLVKDHLRVLSGADEIDGEIAAIQTLGSPGQTGCAGSFDPSGPTRGSS